MHRFALLDDTAPREAPAPGDVRFFLFGGVRIVRGGAAVAVTQPKQRRLLALLLAGAGDVLPVGAAVSALWDGRPSASAVNQLHRHVGALRRACEPGLGRRQSGRFIAGGSRGYRLVPAPGASDVDRFRQLATRARRLDDAGDHPRALAASLQALAIAASPAGDEGMSELPEFAFLEDERTAAVLLAAQLCRRPADVAAVLPHLRAACGQHPFDELLAATTIDALTRMGRDTDAVRLYRTMRRRLVEELGCEPGVPLRAAASQSLRTTVTAPARPTLLSRPAQPAQPARRAARNSASASAPARPAETADARR